MTASKSSIPQVVKIEEAGGGQIKKEEEEGTLLKNDVLNITKEDNSNNELFDGPPIQSSPITNVNEGNFQVIREIPEKTMEYHPSTTFGKSRRFIL